LNELTVRLDGTLELGVVVVDVDDGLLLHAAVTPANDKMATITIGRRVPHIDLIFYPSVILSSAPSAHAVQAS
jgi:hypothetical protein